MYLKRKHKHTKFKTDNSNKPSAKVLISCLLFLYFRAIHSLSRLITSEKNGGRSFGSSRKSVSAAVPHRNLPTFQ